MTKKIDEKIAQFLVNFINEYEKSRKYYLKTETIMDSIPELKRMYNSFKQSILDLILENMPKEDEIEGIIDNNLMIGTSGIERDIKKIAKAINKDCTQKIKGLFKEER